MKRERKEKHFHKLRREFSSWKTLKLKKKVLQELNGKVKKVFLEFPRGKLIRSVSRLSL